jgi:hypothetical protein
MALPVNVLDTGLDLNATFLAAPHCCRALYTSAKYEIFAITYISS